MNASVQTCACGIEAVFLTVPLEFLILTTNIDLGIQILSPKVCNRCIE